MSSKASASASTATAASESASKRRTKAAAPAAAPAPAVAAPASTPTPAAPAAAAAETKGTKRKAPASGDAKPKKATEVAEVAVPKPSEPEVEPPAKKPRKTAPKPAAASSAEGEAKAPKKKKAAAAAADASSPAPATEPAPADPATPKPEEDGVEDGNPCIGRYLRALLKVQYGDFTISKDAITQVQKYVYQFGLHFLIAVKRHLESAKKNTLMMQDMPMCLQRSLSRSSLYTEFSTAMTKALTLYYASYQGQGQGAAAGDSVVAAVDEKRKQMWAARAGLSIPPTRTKEFAKTYLPNFRFSQNSITGLTALFECLALRIFTISYDKAQESSRKRISQLNVQTAVRSDSELSWLLIEPELPLV